MKACTKIGKMMRGYNLTLILALNRISHQKCPNTGGNLSLAPSEALHDCWQVGMIRLAPRKHFPDSKEKLSFNCICRHNRWFDLLGRLRLLSDSYLRMSHHPSGCYWGPRCSSCLKLVYRRSRGRRHFSRGAACPHRLLLVITFAMASKEASASYTTNHCCGWCRKIL